MGSSKRIKVTAASALRSSSIAQNHLQPARRKCSANNVVARFAGDEAAPAPDLPAWDG